MNYIPDFIVIDDDPINNLICHDFIELTLPDAYIATFTKPGEGLDHIRSKYDLQDSKTAILLLDINMPLLSGWEALEILKEFPPKVIEKISVFILSSSLDPKDKDRAAEDPLVSGYITKALSEAKIRSILSTIESAKLNNNKP